MGTRASFWINDPRDLENRRWLGCLAWDGDEVPELAGVDSEDAFCAAVSSLRSRDDFATPDRGWPFPWDNDVFLTDRTYIWDGEAVMVAQFHRGFYPLDADPDGDDLPEDVPAPAPYDRSQPDSIIVLSAGDVLGS